MSGRARIVGGVVAAGILIALVLLLRGSNQPEGETVTDVAVHVGEVGRATLHRYVTAYGTVEPEPALDGRPAAGALITPFTDGVLSSVEVVEGRRVAEGAVLFRLDSRMARVVLEGASRQAAFADSAFQRQEELFSQDGTSRRAYLEARQQRDAARSELAAAETTLAYLNITAPLSGTVLHVDAQVGQHVDATTELARVVDLDRLVVTAGVPSREMRGVAVGQPVLIAAEDSIVAGTVRVLGLDLDPATGTYRVQASIPPGSGLLPGRFTDIRIVAEEHLNVLVVPEEALVRRGKEGSWVAVIEGERALRRPVEVGLDDAGLVEVSGEGIEEGARVVTDEAYSLPEETRIHIVDN